MKKWIQCNAKPSTFQQWSENHSKCFSTVNLIINNPNWWETDQLTIYKAWSSWIRDRWTQIHRTTTILWLQNSLFKAVFKPGSSLFHFLYFLSVPSRHLLVSLHVPKTYVFNLASVDITWCLLKKATPWFVHIGNFSLNFSSSPSLNHPCSFTISVFVNNFRFQFKCNFVHSQNNL